LKNFKKHIIIFYITLAPLLNIKGQGFSFSLNGDTMLVLNSTTDYLSSNLVNLQNNTLAIDIIRIENDMPSNNWYSGLCTDVCYTAITDSIRIYIPPNNTQEFKMYFSKYGTPTSDTAHTKMLFRNVDNPLNAFTQNYYATLNSTILDVIYISISTDILIYPNPVRSHSVLYLKNTQGVIFSFTLFDIYGRPVRTIQNINEPQIVIERQNLNSGIYFFQITTGKNKSYSGNLIFE
jgi:hypothetical protein